jgi:hypothetical protein
VDKAHRAIEMNNHDCITSAYYLLLKKHLESGGKSIADYSSENYDANAFIRTPILPNNLMM